MHVYIYIYLNKTKECFLSLEIFICQQLPTMPFQVSRDGCLGDRFSDRRPGEAALASPSFPSCGMPWGKTKGLHFDASFACFFLIFV